MPNSIICPSCDEKSRVVEFFRESCSITRNGHTHGFIVGKYRYDPSGSHTEVQLHCNCSVCNIGIALTVHPVFVDIAIERIHQDNKYGGPKHDDTHLVTDWVKLILSRLYTVFTGKFVQNRKLFVQSAALSIAAIESQERISKE